LGWPASKAQLMQKYGINQITDELLNQSLTARVNVGMGATDPQGAQLELKNRAGDIQVKRFDAQTKRLALLKPEQQDQPDPIEAIKTQIAARIADAEIDLTQAQTVKTLVEAFMAPSQQLAQRATNVG
jgi:hypothetical protein